MVDDKILCLVGGFFVGWGLRTLAYAFSQARRLRRASGEYEAQLSRYIHSAGLRKTI